MGWPQWTIICCLVIRFLYMWLLDGTPREGEHSFKTFIVGATIDLWVLWCGGVFDSR